MVISYAIGLMMANIAVYVMRMGQPALLYLVPMCLGCMFVVGYKNGEVKEVWDGPKVLRAAESIVRGGTYVVETNDCIEEDDNGLSLQQDDVSREVRNGDEEDFVSGRLT